MEETTRRRFEALYREHGHLIYRVCHRLCRNPTEAEDLAQDVFLLAFRGFGSYSGGAPVQNWLYSIAVNRWRHVLGARQIEMVQLETVDELAVVNDGAGETALALAQALRVLTPAQREAFMLVRTEGLRYREAAAVLGVPQGTVQSRVHEAATRLRAVLGYVAPSNPRRIAGSVSVSEEASAE